MKPLLYVPALLFFALTACRHQHAAVQSNSSDYSSQSTTSTGTTGTTTVTVTETGTTTTSGTTTTTVDAGAPDTVTTTVVAGPTLDTGEVIYRISVSFISKGAGIDYKTQETFENWLKEHPKHPAYVVTHWGREGETNYCLKLNELSTREQEIFVRDVRTMLADNQLVFVDENVPCKGNRVR